MVVTTSIINAIKTAALTEFDSFTHIAVGDDNTAPTINDTALGNEFLRKTVQETFKDVSAGTYILSMRIATTEGNGSTIKEVGIFDAASAGNMGTRDLTTEYGKTSDKEVWIDIFVEVEVTAT